MGQPWAGGRGRSQGAVTGGGGALQELSPHPPDIREITKDTKALLSGSLPLQKDLGFFPGPSTAGGTHVERERRQSPVARLVTSGSLPLTESPFVDPCDLVIVPSTLWRLGGSAVKGLPPAPVLALREHLRSISKGKAGRVTSSINPTFHLF